MLIISPNLIFHKSEGIKHVNNMVGAVRVKYITDIPGQEALYQAKKDMATKYLAESPEPATLDGYYLIAKEVGKTAPTAYELCQLWLNLNALWEMIAGDLEDIRVPTNTAIGNATSRTEINTLVSQAEQDISALGY